MGSDLRIVGRFATTLLVSATLGACTTLAGDPFADAGSPSPLGSGERIRDVMNPASPEHGANGRVVTISGATYLLVHN